MSRSDRPRRLSGDSGIATEAAIVTGALALVAVLILSLILNRALDAADRIDLNHPQPLPSPTQTVSDWP